MGPVRLARRRVTPPCEMRLREQQGILQEIEREVMKRRVPPEALYEQMAEFALDDYWFYLRHILDYRFLDPWDHGEELVHWIMENWGYPQLILVPRGGGKSSCITIPMLPWLIARDPSLCGIILNVREEKAGYFARQAANILISDVYRKCFPSIEPSTRWGAGGYFLTPDQEAGFMGRIDPSIASYGVGGNITGAHVRAVIGDDLINEDTSKRPGEMLKAQSTMKEVLNCLDPGGFLFVCATRWRYRDLYEAMEAGTFQTFGGKFRVFKRGAERTVLDDNGEPCIEIFNRHRTYIDYRGRPQEIGYSPQFLESQKQNLGADYYALYQNTPVASEDHIFALQNIEDRLFDNPPDHAAVWKVGVETESQSADFFEAIIRAMRENNRFFPLEKIIQARSGANTGKHDRIRAVLQPLVENGKLYLRRDLWSKPNNLGQEFREFDKGDDDALDALTHCVSRAPNYDARRGFLTPYIAVDPAFTIKTYSHFTAIVCGGWFHEDFYVLDCVKFKAQKTDIRIQQIFNMFDRYSIEKRNANPDSPGTRVRSFVSPGNERGYRVYGKSKRRNNLWQDPEEILNGQGRNNLK